MGLEAPINKKVVINFFGETEKGLNLYYLGLWIYSRNFRK
jgi:hypothetical protein